MGWPYGSPSPCGASGGSPGVIPCCFPRVTVGSTRCAWQLEDFGLCCTLVPRISPRIRFPVRSARVFASGFLSAPLAGIQLPSATLWRHLPGAGLTRLISSSFPRILSRFSVDRVYRTGTLSRVHPQAAGRARHTTKASMVASPARHHDADRSTGKKTFDAGMTAVIP